MAKKQAKNCNLHLSLPAWIQSTVGQPRWFPQVSHRSLHPTESVLTVPTAAAANCVSASNVCFAACEWQLAQSVKSEAEAVTEKLMEALKQHISVSITADDFSEALRRLFANKAASN